MTLERSGSAPIHPGEVLEAEFLIPHGLSRARLARAMGLSYGRLTRLSQGRTRIGGEAALLLARIFQTTPEFWLNLQAHCDLARASAAHIRAGRARQGIWHPAAAITAALTAAFLRAGSAGYLWR